ncbi:whirlin [Plakobranchus ocellatus]|uniref:Whirlin n=1 Tax=Plakobranchus ocellatus TaxID=259542 RepID=A0AAV4BQ83_9GAST|nr:whirlin [Plakobranchus ocellatus]
MHLLLSALPSRWGHVAWQELEVLLYPSKKGKLGCGVYRDDHGHLVVKNVEKNSAASKAGLCKHDRFLEIDGMKVAGLTDKQVGALTNVKRMRIKVQRFTGSTSSKGKGSKSKAKHSEFDNALSLDLSPLGLADDDIVSSTPRRPAGRAHSEDRRSSKNKGHQVVHQHQQQQQQQYQIQGRSISQAGSRSNNGTNGAISASDTAMRGGGDDTEEDEAGLDVVTQTVQVDVHCARSPRESTAQHNNNSVNLMGQGAGEENGATGEGVERMRKDSEESWMKSNHFNGEARLDSVSADEDVFDNPKSNNSSEETITPQHSPVEERRVSPVRRYHSQPRAQASSPQSQPHFQVTSNFIAYPNHHYHQHHQHPHYQQHQARIYRPRVVQQAPQNHQQMAMLHSKRSLARYMTASKQGSSNHSALPSRVAMVYSPTPFTTAGEVDRDRSRPKKRGVPHSASASSKMRQLRNRSQSPHAIHMHNSQSRDREFLRAIQNSVERRQRAHRLSLYQLPDHDDDAWNIG